MIALFAALQLEIQRFLGRLDIRDGLSLPGYALTLGEYGGQGLLVCRTGMGLRAGAAAAALLERYRPEAVLSVGLAGALSPACRVGDLLFAERVYRADPGGEGGVPAEHVLSDGRLLETARRTAGSCRLSSRIGGSLTVSEPVTDPHRKARLLTAAALDVVEMESYWVGRVAQDQGVSFLAARVVSDGVQDALPNINGVITPQGEKRWRQGLAYALRHPGRVPLLIRTARTQTRAVANLTRFLEAFVSVFGGSLKGESA